MTSTADPVAGVDLLAEETELSFGDRLSLLADPHRRSVIACLDRVSDDIAVERLADRVATELADSETVDDERRRRVLFALHHNHLPHLDEHGVIEYDYDAGTVTPT